VEKSLADPKWNYRLPFFAAVVSPGEVSLDGASQIVMDREIAYAAKAGLDYWAFVTYGPSDPMSLGLNHYLSSQHRRDIRFCLITELGRWGNPQTYPGMVARLASLMREDTYQKVANRRPLLYLGFVQDEALAKVWGGVTGLRKAVDALREAARGNGAGDPYVVIMDFNPVHGAKLREELGADAISSYAAQGGEKSAPYAALAAYAQRFWNRCKDTGSPVVPIVMSGWDRRPRVINPTPWERYQKPGVGIELFYESPTPTELAGHLERALMWVEDNPTAAPARTVLIYAWNENDEGGWLVPTLCDGTARLDAIERVLKGQ
jgi:hypothetical protein